MRLSKRKAFWAILITIWLYTLFVGASPTVIRAAVMGTIVVLGKRLERRVLPLSVVDFSRLKLAVGAQLCGSGSD